MAQNISAPRDDNGEMALLATNRTDESKVVLLYADPDTHSLLAPALEQVLNTTTAIYANSLIVRTTAGRLKGLTGYNSNAGTQFIQIHDARSVPPDNAIPKIIISVSTVSNFSIDFGQIGRYFTVGIVVCNSSTGPTKTIGAADCWFDVQHAN